METVRFSDKVYRLCRKIPKGKVTTYKEIARVLGTKGYRAVGQVLRCNPYAPHIPCHRVVNSDGRLGGFRGEIEGKEITVKRQLLQREGVVIHGDAVDLSVYLHILE